MDNYLVFGYNQIVAKWINNMHDIKSKSKSEYDDLDKYEYDNGDIYYCKKDTVIYHNPYGPAVIWKNGYKIYYVNGERHRLDGPAIIYSNGEVRYLINNKCLTKEEFDLHPERLKFLGKEHLACLG